MELPIITLLANAAAIGIVTLIIRRWTTDAKDESVRVTNEVREENAQLMKEMQADLEKIKSEIICKLNEAEKRMTSSIEKKLDRELFEARMETNKQAHEQFIRDIERNETCIMEVKKKVEHAKWGAGA